MRPEERAEVRVLLTEKHGPQDPPPSRNFLIKILLLFLELPFRAANVPHPGRAGKLPESLWLLERERKMKSQTGQTVSQWAWDREYPTS